MIRCEMCGQEMNVISWKHLKRHDITVEEYKNRYPGSPMMSNEAQAAKSAGGKKANVHKVGKPRSADVKQKISSTKKKHPRPAWNKGIPMSDEQKVLLSETKARQYQTGQIVHWNVGRTTPDETRAKISQTLFLQHRTYSDESKNKRNSTYAEKSLAGWTHPSTQRLEDKLSDEALAKLNSPDWLHHQHITNQRTISSLCCELGLHWKNSNKTVAAYLKKHNIPVQYYHQASSQQQADVERFLSDCGVKYTTRDRTLIAPLELDIVMPDKKIAIEYCGLYWHSTEYKEPDYHKNKYDRCAEQGYTLITIYSDEWLTHPDIVKQALTIKLGLHTQQKLGARSCTIAETSTKERAAFLNMYHIQGDGPGSVTYSLEHGGTVVACMTFIRKKRGTWILNRYASSRPVQGGFSKLLKHFISNHHPVEIISFSDNRWSTGYVYVRNGFELDAELPADYEYVVNESRVHKFNFRHKYLPHRLQHYDSALTELENTTKAGVHRIYDCGKRRWVLKCVNTGAQI